MHDAATLSEFSTSDDPNLANELVFGQFVFNQQLGHSQGGFLTYSVLMNYPDLIDGAVPVSGGMILQAVPSAFDNPDLIALQKRIPIAVVHGRSDPNVSFKLAESASDALTKAEYRSKLFAHDKAGHAFALLPIPDAIQ